MGSLTAAFLSIASRSQEFEREFERSRSQFLAPGAQRPYDRHPKSPTITCKCTRRCPWNDSTLICSFREHQSAMKRIRPRSRRRQSGITFVELLVAGLILSIGMMGMVNVWSYSFFVTGNSDDSAIAYNLGRQSIERAKQSGFTSAAEGTATTYYSGNQVVQSSAGASRYTVTTRIVSDVMKSGTSGASGGVPADTALRTVSVTVTLTTGGTTLYTTQTYLCRAGI
jgi:Tfp pilus assembly protein PilV